MSFCPVCGRDHKPGPCPIPSVEPESPDWEAKQYTRISVAAMASGLILLVISQLTQTIDDITAVLGFLSLLVGGGLFLVARKKNAELDSATRG